MVNIITGAGSEVGRVLCTSPKVDKIAFTGSTEVGRQIMKMGADTIKKVTLELGGKSQTSSVKMPRWILQWTVVCSVRSSIQARSANQARGSLFIKRYMMST